jgi:hypothetical protein
VEEMKTVTIHWANFDEPECITWVNDISIVGEGNYQFFVIKKDDEEILIRADYVKRLEVK